jgi:hypothetical protein
MERRPSQRTQLTNRYCPDVALTLSQRRSRPCLYPRRLYTYNPIRAFAILVRQGRSQQRENGTQAGSHLGPVQVLERRQTSPTKSGNAINTFRGGRSGGGTSGVSRVRSHRISIILPSRPRSRARKQAGSVMAGIVLAAIEYVL